MAYLPVNPCCTGVVLNTTCGCNSTCNCNSTTNSCGTTGALSNTIVYNGPTLPGSGVEACDTLNVALSKIDEVLVELKAQVALNTTAISNITEQINNINAQITTINNNCCP
jgi:hypothetical protein